jgi:hypothetical protein
MSEALQNTGKNEDQEEISRNVAFMMLAGEIPFYQKMR